MLASSAYYLTITKYSWENFHDTLKNHENCKSLAQRIFPHLQYHNYITCKLNDYCISLYKFLVCVTAQKYAWFSGKNCNCSITLYRLATISAKHIKHITLIEQSHTATEMMNVHNNFLGCHMPDIFKEILQWKLFSSASMIYTICISCGYQCYN